jgi:hypothetical protein
MQTSKYCITDLSYQRLHNIPFELGYFIALGRQGHSFILMDKKYDEIDGSRVRKFDAQMSNLKGVEIIVHDNNPNKLVRELLRRMQRDVPEAKIDGLREPLAKDILKFAKKVEGALKQGTLDEFVRYWSDLYLNAGSINTTQKKQKSAIINDQPPTASISTATKSDTLEPRQQ